MMTQNLMPTVLRFSHPVTRRRFTNAAVTKGRVASPTYADTTITGYITPVDGQIQRTLPEALREHVGAVMYTKDDVRTVEQDTGELPDSIMYGGQEYQCREVQHHLAQGLFRVLALQVVPAGSTY